MITHLRNDFEIIAKLSVATKELAVATAAAAETKAVLDELQARVTELEARDKAAGTVNLNARKPMGQSEPTGRGSPIGTENNETGPTCQNRSLEMHAGPEEKENNISAVNNMSEPTGHDVRMEGCAEEAQNNVEAKEVENDVGQDGNKPMRELVCMRSRIQETGSNISPRLMRT